MIGMNKSLKNKWKFQSIKLIIWIITNYFLISYFVFKNTKDADISL